VKHRTPHGAILPLLVLIAALLRQPQLKQAPGAQVMECHAQLPLQYDLLLLLVLHELLHPMQ
jgi:hypothetical protein